jgi:hypothetical protein
MLESTIVKEEKNRKGAAFPVFRLRDAYGAGVPIVAGTHLEKLVM